MSASGISVLIPVYNGADYLDACIRSVVDQSLPAEEIVILDDGSEDATPSVATAWGDRVRYLRVPHGGLPYARNHALRAARGDVIAFIDADDLWLPNKLALQMAALARAEKPAMVFGGLVSFLSEDLTPEEAAKLVIDPEPVAGLAPSTCLMRRKDSVAVGPFDETIRIGEFIEWCSRARDAGFATVLVPEIVCRRRVHRANMSRGRTGAHAEYPRMLKKVLDRRRGLS